MGKLEQYHYTIVYGPCLTHGKGDNLSQRPCSPECQRYLHKESVQRVCRSNILEQSEEMPEMTLEKLQWEDRICDHL